MTGTDVDGEETRMAKLQVAVTAEDHSRGEMSAPVTLVEYGDFQCPHCAMAHALVTRLERHYGERLRFVYRNFPLIEIHPMAEPAAEAAEFAASKGRYWEMHDSIFAHQRRLSVALLAELAGRLEMDESEAAAAIRESRFSERIEGDLDGGVRSGVHGTPTFFINGEGYAGSWEFEELSAAIDKAM